MSGRVNFFKLYCGMLLILMNHFKDSEHSLTISIDETSLKSDGFKDLFCAVKVMIQLLRYC